MSIFFFELDVLQIQFFELIHLLNDSVKPSPFESRFLAIDRVTLFNEPNGLKNICNVVESTYFGLKLLLLVVPSFFGFRHGYFFGRFVQSDDTLPRDEEVDELLAEDS